MVALAAGAVAELQLRAVHIRAAADGTLVGVGSLGLGMGGLIAAGRIEGDGLAPGVDGLLCGTVCVDTPGNGHQIQAVLAEGQEIVTQGDDGEQTVREEIEHTNEDDEQIKERKIPCLHRNDEKQGEDGIGVQGGIGQEQAQIQIVGGGHAAEDHAVDIHQQDSGEVEQIKPKGSPEIFDALTQGVVAKQEQSRPEDIVRKIQKHKGDKPPDLTLKDQASVKIEPVGEHIAGVDLTNKIDGKGAEGDIEHQVGDALVPVSEAEPVEIPAQIFHGGSPQRQDGAILPVAPGKVQSQL